MPSSKGDRSISTGWGALDLVSNFPSPLISERAGRGRGVAAGVVGVRSISTKSPTNGGCGDITRIGILLGLGGVSCGGLGRRLGKAELLGSANLRAPRFESPAKPGATAAGEAMGGISIWPPSGPRNNGTETPCSGDGKVENGGHSKGRDVGSGVMG